MGVVIPLEDNKNKQASVKPLVDLTLSDMEPRMTEAGLDGDAIGNPIVESFRTRFKVFDYGVVSVALRREFSGEWADLVRLVADLIIDDALGRAAEASVRF